MRCECMAERASEKLVQSGRPGPWPGDSCVTNPFRAGPRRRDAKGRPGPRPGDSCVTSPHGVTAPDAALASEAEAAVHRAVVRAPSESVSQGLTGRQFPSAPC